MKGAGPSRRVRSLLHLGHMQVVRGTDRSLSNGLPLALPKSFEVRCVHDFAWSVFDHRDAEP